LVRVTRLILTNQIATTRQTPIVRRAFQQRLNSTVATETPKKSYSKWKVAKNIVAYGAVGFVGYTIYGKRKKRLYCITTERLFLGD
jgi:hypothetical protein